MKITMQQIRRIIREEIQREAQEALSESRIPPMESMKNSAPPQDSNWRAFADAVDIGVLDLDEIAYALKFNDFYEMDLSITPRALAQRDPNSFISAVRQHALFARTLADEEILAAAQRRNT